VYLGLWFFAQATTYFSVLRIQAWYEHSLSGADTNRYQIPNFLYRALFPHNIWVHFEHHQNPGIPFYNLEAARALNARDKIYSFSEMVTELSGRSTRNNENREKAA
jgi:fatty acid desaturase